LSPAREEIFNDAFAAHLRDYLAEHDPRAKDLLRDALVKQSLPYVQKIAKGLARRVTDPVDDLIQVGCLGLMKALDKYNPTMGTQFKTYATYLITGEIRHYLRDKCMMIKAPRTLYELYYRMNQIVQRLTDDLGRTPTDLEIAEALHCPVETIHGLNQADRRKTTISLDQFITELTGNEGVYVERLVDERSQEAMRTQEQHILLDTALRKLPEDLKRVVELIYFEDLSQSDAAEVLGVSQMQVSRRLKKALERLHELLTPEEADVH